MNFINIVFIISPEFTGRMLAASLIALLCVVTVIVFLIILVKGIIHSRRESTESLPLIDEVESDTEGENRDFEDNYISSAFDLESLNDEYEPGDESAVEMLKDAQRVYANNKENNDHDKDKKRKFWQKSK